jgi:hypothetical protein
MLNVGPRDQVDTYTVEYGNPKSKGWLSNAWDGVSRQLLKNFYLIADHKSIIGEDRAAKTLQVTMTGQDARAFNAIGYRTFLPA